MGRGYIYAAAWRDRTAARVILGDKTRRTEALRNFSATMVARSVVHSPGRCEETRVKIGSTNIVHRVISPCSDLDSASS